LRIVRREPIVDRALSVLDRDTGKHLGVVGWSDGTLARELRDADRDGLQVAEQNLRPRERLGHQPLQYLAVVPFAEEMLYAPRPLERRLGGGLAETAGDLHAIAQPLGGDS